jgi:hypothetical protein
MRATSSSCCTHVGVSTRRAPGSEGDRRRSCSVAEWSAEPHFRPRQPVSYPATGRVHVIGQEMGLVIVVYPLARIEIPPVDGSRAHTHIASSFPTGRSISFEPCIHCPRGGLRPALPAGRLSLSRRVAIHHRHLASYHARSRAYA